MIPEQSIRDSPKGLGHRKDIDGLRAIAIASVIAYHCGPRWAGGGFAGVDVFFVISGYLIGYGVYRDIREGDFSITRFYSRRAKRILPALFGVLIFTYLVGMLLFSPRELQLLAKSTLATLGFSSNIFLWRTSGYFDPSAERNPLLMTWTLSVEEQFYLVFPIVMLLLRKISRQRLILVLVAGEALSLAVSIWSTVNHPTAAFYLLPSRAWEIGAGVLLAVFDARPSGAPGKGNGIAVHAWSMAGLICILASAHWLTANAAFGGYSALLPVAGTAMLIAARDGIGNRILSVRPIVFVGLISYSWYLWHWPLLSFAFSLAMPVPSSSLVMLALVSFAVAVLSWRFIEQPFRRSQTMGPRLLARYAAIALLAGLPAIFMLVPAAGAFRRNLNPLDRVGDSLESDVCHVPYGNQSPDFAPPCIPKISEASVALVGDSHAAALAPTVRQLANRYGYGLVELTKSSCPALDGITVHIAGHPLHDKECADFNREVLDYITHNPAIRIVIITAYWSGALRHEAIGDRYVVDGEEARGVSSEKSLAFLQMGLDREVRALSCAGKDVYLVQESPVFDFDPVSRLQDRMIRPRRWLARLLSGGSSLYDEGIAAPHADRAAADSAQIVRAIAKLEPEVHVINPEERLCSPAGCRFALGQQSLYVDEHHLSPFGARLALSNFTLPLDVPRSAIACALGH